jgi:hypothetical protein
MRTLIWRTVAFLALVAFLTSLGVAQGSWVSQAQAPVSGGYGEALVGDGCFIYLARCYEVGSCDKKGSGNPRPQFFRYEDRLNRTQYPNKGGNEKCVLSFYLD